MVSVEQWAQIRRAHFIEGVGIRALARRTGLDRQTIRRWLRSDEPPRYERAAVVGKLELYREEIHRLLGEDGRLPATRIRELIADQGCGVAARSWRRICVRCDRCLRRRRARFSGRCIDPGRSASSTCGSRAARYRSATASCAAAGSW